MLLSPAMNVGFEHSDLQDLDKGIDEIDDNTRWAVAADVGHFIFGNAMPIRLYGMAATFLSSAKIDAWEVMGGANDWLSNWEYCAR